MTVFNRKGLEYTRKDRCHYDLKQRLLKNSDHLSNIIELKTDDKLNERVYNDLETLKLNLRNTDYNLDLVESIKDSHLHTLILEIILSDEDIKNAAYNLLTDGKRCNGLLYKLGLWWIH
jgi:hypothetical protein